MDTIHSKLFLLGKVNIVVLIFTFFACGNNNSQNKTTSNENIASPSDSIVPNEYNVLTYEDRLKLARAIGMTAEMVSFETIKTKINKASGKLHIYAFWLVEQPESLTFINSLIKLQNEIGEQQLKLILINLDQKDNMTQVNTFIREKGITNEVVMLDELSIEDWQSQINPTWDGTIPAILFTNSDNGTNLFYQGAFSFEELMVIIQPLMI